MNRLLVIGYGNTLRGDDAVGPRAVAAIEQWRLPEVKLLSLHQLTPELADPIAGSGAVLFIDAAIDTHEVRLDAVEPIASNVIHAHTLDPAALLALARDLFGHAPPAWMLRIPVENMELGERLSAVAERGLDEALRLARALCERLRIQPHPGV